MDTKPVLAVDFGTSNTYITKCLGDQSVPVGIDFGDGRDGLATAILYIDGKEPIIGDKALEEFGDATEVERQSYTIRTQFKPDLAQSDKAQKYSRDFLASLIKSATQQHITLQPLSSQVIFGVPSDATVHYREKIKAICAEAGFGAIQVIDEPKGAIFYHLKRGDITPLEAMQGALVVDFGGGTCDFALVVKGEVIHSWGDMHLGGRLIDDVFYQWLIEQNNHAVASMNEENAEFYVLWSLCRQVKEKFSQLMVLDRGAIFRKSFGEFGRIENATWENFLKRLSLYRPSDTFTHYLREVNPGVMDNFHDGCRVDLVDWFRQSLRKGLQHENVRHNKVACVALTGGSSLWPFVSEIVQEEMALIGMNPRFVRSDRPYATISEGLSIIPSLQRHFTAVQSTLREETPAFIREKVNPIVDRRIEEAIECIANSVTCSLFDNRIKPILVDFCQTGGAVSSIKQRIAQQTELFKPEIDSIVKDELGLTLSSLPVNMCELMAEWFKKYDLIFQHDYAQVDSMYGETDLIDNINIYGEIEVLIDRTSISIITSLVSAISGSAGLALIAHGPIGLAIGAVIGALVGYHVVFFGREEAKRKVEDWDGCPTWIINTVLSENKISNMRVDIERQIKENMIEQSCKAKMQIEQQIQQIVNYEIERLSAINRV